MKKVFFLFALALIPLFTFSQEAFNYTEEVNRSANVPNTPGAQAFAQYGNVPINLFAGKSNVSVPIYSYSGREMNLPISLTYDMDARKVEDIASSVGMGWNLNLGGRISRIVNGLPDDYVSSVPAGGYTTLLKDTGFRAKYNNYKPTFYNHNVNYPQAIDFATEQDAKDYFEFIYQAEIGQTDIHMDDYSLNVMGLNDHIIIDDSNLDATPIENIRTKITYTIGNNNNQDYITEWVVTDDSGTKYTFAQGEQTQSFNYDDIGNVATTNIYDLVYNSSWLLTKIESPNLKDIYTFSYVDRGFWAEETQTNSVHATDYGPSINGAIEHTPNTWYKHKQQFLKTVYHNGNAIVNITYKNRDDLDIINSAVKSITIKSPIDGATVKYVEFDNGTYFGPPTSSNPDLDELRLKLDGIKIAGAGYDGSPSYDFKQEYSFDYHVADSMPRRTSFARDVEGFFNGQYSNDDLQGSPPEPVLYPRQDVEIAGQTIAMQGADRSFDVDKAKIGILSRITYPTGGYTEFEYEQHMQTIFEPNSTTQVAGSISVVETATPDLTQCGSCCQSQTTGQAAKVAVSSFGITTNTNFNYKISYSVDFGEVGNDYKAFIVGPLGPSETYTYEDICDTTVSVPIYREFQGKNNSIIYDVLPIGVYQMFVYNPDEDLSGYSCNNTGECSRVSLTVSYTSTTGQTAVDYFYPGLRVKSVTDYTDENQSATKKIFEYGQLEENYDLVLNYQTSERYLDPSGNAATQTVYHRLGKPIMGSEPYITYGDVTEKRVNPTTGTGSIGYVHHEFFNAGNTGSVPRGAPPFSRDYVSNVRKGKLKRNSVYDASDNKETESTSTYNTEIGDYFTGVAVADAPSNGISYIRLYNDNGIVKFEFVEGVENTQAQGLMPPPICTDPSTLECLTSNANSRVVPRYVYSSREHLTSSENQSVQYFGNNQVTNESKTFYDSALNYLASESHMQTSENNQTIITKYTYPEELPSEPQMSALEIANRISAPVEVATYQKQGLTAEEIMQRQKTTFANFSGKILPETTKTAKASILNSDLEERISYSYDDKGNPKQINRPGGLPTSFIWGYNQEVPVAKIEGVSHSSISTTILDDIHDGSATGTANEQDMITALNALRTAFPTALITTYTYLPLIGLSTVTDTKGYTMSYHYDDENRLKYVKDQDGNVLSAQEYNLRNQ